MSSNDVWPGIWKIVYFIEYTGTFKQKEQKPTEVALNFGKECYWLCPDCLVWSLVPYHSIVVVLHGSNFLLSWGMMWFFCVSLCDHDHQFTESNSLYSVWQNTQMVETCRWHILYWFCLSSISVSPVLSFSRQGERESMTWRDKDRERRVRSQWESICSSVQKIHFIMRTYCYWFWVWMLALIWLNHHYTVVPNNPNVIRLKACLMLSIQGNIFFLHFSRVLGTISHKHVLT